MHRYDNLVVGSQFTTAVARRLGLASLVLVASLASARADSLDDCNQARNTDIRLRACSEVISGARYRADDKARAYRNRGNLRADAGAGTQAVADFSEAIRLNPNEVSGYAGRARARLAVQDLDCAIADYGDALRLGPGTAAFHVGRGHAHFVRGDTTAAIADFTEAIRLNPNSPSTYNRRGLAFRRSGNLERALDDYTAAITLNPVYALAYNNRGYIYEAQGRKDDAVIDFQAALLLDPSLTGARDGLVRLGVPPAFLEETQKRVEDGKALVEQNCSACHAVGVTGASPNASAPRFCDLHARHPSLALREPLSRGIAAPHDLMPKFALSGPRIDTIVAYINSLSAAKAAPPRTKRWAADRRSGRRRRCPKGVGVRAQDLCRLPPRAAQRRPIAEPARTDLQHGCQHARHVRDGPDRVVAHGASHHAEPGHQSKRYGQPHRLHPEPARPQIVLQAPRRAPPDRGDGFTLVANSTILADAHPVLLT